MEKGPTAAPRDREADSTYPRSATHASFEYVLAPFGLGCEECEYLKENILPALVPLLEELLRLAVEENLSQPENAGFQSPHSLSFRRQILLPEHVKRGSLRPIVWLATELKRRAATQGRS
eukprot:TRINITY_DN3304_c0_g1_i2.p1 TRINITY_DN3304_c0_g1~~TRINITY_DN3304_c0_g1_i2.p1  ORF type:complete len:120 (+),score=6.96 TRINITY_DN3304_c0_g1_i2:36-395(+)